MARPPPVGPARIAVTTPARPAHIGWTITEILMSKFLATDDSIRAGPRASGAATGSGRVAPPVVEAAREPTHAAEPEPQEAVALRLAHAGSLLRPRRGDRHVGGLVLVVGHFVLALRGLGPDVAIRRGPRLSTDGDTLAIPPLHGRPFRVRRRGSRQRPGVRRPRRFHDQAAASRRPADRRLRRFVHGRGAPRAELARPRRGPGARAGRAGRAARPRRQRRGAGELVERADEARRGRRL